MEPLRTKALPRRDIGAFINSERGIRSYEDLQADVGGQYEALATGAFLTLESDANLGAERVLTLSAGLTGEDGGAGGPYTLGLSDTNVDAGTYGDASHLVRFTVDAKGRLTSAAQFALESGNVAETTNLYFTDARARAVITAGFGLSYNTSTGLIEITTTVVTLTGIQTLSNKSLTSATLTGTTTLPGGGSIDSNGHITSVNFRPRYNPANDWGIDFASTATEPQRVTIANSATFDIPTGSGMVFIFDDSTLGAAAQIACWFGSTSVVWQDIGAAFSTTIGTAGKVNVYYNAGNGRYRIQNLTGGSITLSLGLMRVRNAS